MKKEKIFYIETTLNGYIFKQIPICDYERGKDYCGELHFKLDGEEKEYYEDIAGDYDELDRFLKFGNHLHCKEYDNIIDTKPHVYLEYFYTTSMGWFDDRFVGIMVGYERYFNARYFIKDCVKEFGKEFTLEILKNKWWIKSNGKIVCDGKIKSSGELSYYSDEDWESTYRPKKLTNKEIENLKQLKGIRL